MAIEQTFTSNGTTKVFTISEFDFLRTSDIKVFIDPTGGTAKTLVTENTSAVAGQYTIDKTAKTITFISSNIQGSLQTNEGSGNAGAPLAGVVTAQRITAVDTPISTFQAGSAITATDLNNALDQVRFNINEFSTLTNSGSLSDSDKGDITVSNSGNTWTIDNSAVTRDKILNDAINSDKIDDNSINSEHYVDASIDREHLSADIIDGTKIEDNAIGPEHIGNDQINSQHYAAGSIDLEHMSDKSVDYSKIKTLNTDSADNLTFLQKNSGLTSGLVWNAIPIRAGEILETFTLPCTGSSITVGSGTYTTQNVTAVQSQVGTSYVDLTGSSIAYTPPSGTQLVIYKFYFHMGNIDGSAIAHFKLFLDSDEVTKARVTYGAQKNDDDHNEGRRIIEWPFQISGSADTTSGKVAAGGWTSAKTIKIQYRDYSDVHEGKLHETAHWDGGSSSQLTIPTISITAIN